MLLHLNIISEVRDNVILTETNQFAMSLFLSLKSLPSLAKSAWRVKRLLLPEQQHDHELIGL